MKTLIIAWLLFASITATSRSQTYPTETYPVFVQYTMPESTDAAVFTNIGNGGTDSLACSMRSAYEYRGLQCPVVYFDNRLYPTSDSFTVWLKCEDSLTIYFGECDLYNVIGVRRTLVGPFNWQPFSVRMYGQKFYCVELSYYDSAGTWYSPIGPQLYIGAAFVHVPDASVTGPDSPMNEAVSPMKRPTEFIDVLGRPAKPSQIYKILPDGRALVW